MFEHAVDTSTRYEHLCIAFYSGSKDLGHLKMSVSQPQLRTNIRGSAAALRVLLAQWWVYLLSVVFSF